MTKNNTPPADLTPTTLFEGLGLDDNVPVGESPHVTFAGDADAFALPSGGLSDGMMDEDPVEIGVRVAHVVDPSRLCMGYIGRTKTKFCILAKEKCTVQSHRIRSFEDASTGLYCLDTTSTGVNAGICLTVPSVSKTLLQDNEYHAFMAESKDLEDLQQQFSIIGMREEPGEIESAEAVTTLMAQVDEYKTPKKEKLAIMRHDDTDKPGVFTMQGGTSFKGAVDNFWSTLDGFKDTTAPKKLKVDEVQEEAPRWDYDIRKIKDYLKIQGNILDAFAHTVSDKLMLVDGLVHKLRTVEDKIGTQSTLLKRHGTEPVLWNAIAGIVDSGTSAMLDHERLKQISEGTDLKLEKMQNELQLILKSFKNKIDSNSRDLRSCKDEVESVRKMSSKIGNKVSSESDDQKEMGQVGSSFLGLSFLDNTPDTSGPSNSGKASANQGRADGSSETADNLNKADLWTTMKLVDTLQDRLSALELFKQGQDEKMLEEAVKIMDVVFTGKDDVERWYCNSVPESDGVPPCGLFIDPLIALFWIGTRIDGGGASRTKLDNLLKGKKLEMSELEMGAYESFDSDIPTVFLGESKEKTVITDEDKSKLANLPSFKAWHHPGREKGLSQQIRKAAQLVKGALHNAITDSLRKHDKLYAMALDMLETSFEFVTQLCSYITNTFIDFRELEVGSEKDIWNLITFVVEHLFKNDFAKARQLSITRLNASDRDSAFVVMWCSLRSVAVAKSLSSVGISDSPAVSASYVRFVLTQSNRGKISAVEEENSALRKELDALKADVAAIKAQAKEAKRTADSAMSKVNKKPRVGEEKKS